MRHRKNRIVQTMPPNLAPFDLESKLWVPDLVLTLLACTPRLVDKEMFAILYWNYSIIHNPTWLLVVYLKTYDTCVKTHPDFDFWWCWPRPYSSRYYIADWFLFYSQKLEFTSSVFWTKLRPPGRYQNSCVVIPQLSWLNSEERLPRCPRDLQRGDSPVSWRAQPQRWNQRTSRRTTPSTTTSSKWWEREMWLYWTDCYMRNEINQTPGTVYF